MKLTYECKSAARAYVRAKSKTFIAPQDWGAYIIYGDSSGISETEIALIDAIIDGIVKVNGSCHVYDYVDLGESPAPNGSVADCGWTSYAQYAYN